VSNLQTDRDRNKMYYQAIAISSLIPVVAGFKVDPAGQKCPTVSTFPQFRYIAHRTPNTDTETSHSLVSMSKSSDLSPSVKLVKFPKLAAWIDEYVANNNIEKSKLQVVATDSEDRIGGCLKTPSWDLRNTSLQHEDTLQAVATDSEDRIDGCLKTFSWDLRNTSLQDEETLGVEENNFVGGVDGVDSVYIYNHQEMCVQDVLSELKITRTVGDFHDEVEVEHLEDVREERKWTLSNIRFFCEQPVEFFDNILPPGVTLSNRIALAFVIIFLIAALYLEIQQRKLTQMLAQDKTFVEEEKELLKRKNGLIATVERQADSNASSSEDIMTAKLALDKELENIVSCRLELKIDQEEISQRLESTIQHAMRGSRTAGKCLPISTELSTPCDRDEYESLNALLPGVGEDADEIKPLSAEIPEPSDVTNFVSDSKYSESTVPMPVESTSEISETTAEEVATESKTSLIVDLPLTRKNSSDSESTIPILLESPSENSSTMEVTAESKSSLIGDPHPEATAVEVTAESKTSLIVDLNLTRKKSSDSESTIPILLESPSEDSETMEVTKESKSPIIGDPPLTKKKRRFFRFRRHEKRKRKL
jgi:hypothetical protein